MSLQFAKTEWISQGRMQSTICWEEKFGKFSNSWFFPLCFCAEAQKFGTKCNFSQFFPPLILKGKICPPPLPESPTENSRPHSLQSTSTLEKLRSQEKQSSTILGTIKSWNCKNYQLESRFFKLIHELVLSSKKTGKFFKKTVSLTIIWIIYECK